MSPEIVPKECGEFTIEELRRVSNAVRVPGRGSIYEHAPRFEPRPSRIGSIYFVGAADNGPVKIGFTNNVKVRLGRLQVGSPVRLTLLAVAHGREQSEEAAYHLRFRFARLHGEWFERCPEIEAEIERLTAQQA